MKKCFITGLIILLPIAFTLWILFFFLDFLTEPFVGIAEELFHSILPRHQGLIIFASRLIIIAGFICLIFLLGFIGQKFFFRTLLRFTEKIFSKIPLVKTIYRLFREITHAVVKTESKAFKSTVLAPFPMEKSKALGLVINDLPTPLLEKEKLKSVFIPTSPHPISGFLLMFPEDSLEPLDVSTEDVFKILLSCGIVQPKLEPEDKTK